MVYTCNHKHTKLSTYTLFCIWFEWTRERACAYCWSCFHLSFVQVWQRWWRRRLNTYKPDSYGLIGDIHLGNRSAIHIETRWLVSSQIQRCALAPGRCYNDRPFISSLARVRSQCFSVYLCTSTCALTNKVFKWLYYFDIIELTSFQTFVIT